MKKLILILVTACLGWSAQAAETGTVIESFQCKLKTGKTLADFDAANAYWKAQMDASGMDPNGVAATLLPMRANSEYDVVWVGASPNLNDWAATTAKYEASAEGRSAEERFSKVIDCESGLYFSTPIHQALPVEEGDLDSVIEGHACTLNDGRTMADVEAAEKIYVAALEAMKATDPKLANITAVRWMPFLANTPADMVYLVVSDDLDAFGRTNSAFQTSPGGVASNAAFERAINCESGLWSGKVLRRPATR